MDLARYEPTLFENGRHTGGPHGYVAYFPSPIPRDVEISQGVYRLALEAEVALAELNGVRRLLPNPHLLAHPFLRREAVSSTRIEGTQASLTDLFEAEATNTAPSDDVQEVVNYVNAFHHGVERSHSLPLSIRLIREMHAIILAGARGQERHPGELRTSQNWIGTGGATLAAPLLYLSPYLEAHRQAYYDALQGVRERGDLETWLQLILEGIRVQSIDAATRAQELLALREHYRAIFAARNSSSVIATIDLAFQSPVLNAAMVEHALGVSTDSNCCAEQAR